MILSHRLSQTNSMARWLEKMKQVLLKTQPTLPSLFPHPILLSPYNDITHYPIPEDTCASLCLNLSFRIVYLTLEKKVSCGCNIHFH